MIFSLAPMDGLTGHVYRRVHASCFGPLDRYYTPFLTPKTGCVLDERDLREVDPRENEGLDVIPQVLTRNAADFIAVAGFLANLGYREVNLNLGCPSNTVAGKGKGSGFLRDPAGLEAFLREVCEGSPLPISIKTRIGYADDTEYEALLQMYRRFPLTELIVHPRTKKDHYRGYARREYYGRTLEVAPFPVAYNGDILTPGDLEGLVADYPATRHVMLGRGIIRDPALGRRIKGGPAAEMGELRRFHDLLFEGLEKEMGRKAVPYIKEWWCYFANSIGDPKAIMRVIGRAGDREGYLAAVGEVFGGLR